MLLEKPGQPRPIGNDRRLARAQAAAHEAARLDCRIVVDVRLLHDAGAASIDSGIDAQVLARPKGAPPEVLAAVKEWPSSNRDYAGTRATFDSPIKAANADPMRPNCPKP